MNDPVVVIGKHQNPWREVNLSALLEQGVPLLRRISGGGAVYHDRGNLNFSFLGSKDGFDRRQNLDFVRRVLLSLGIDADISDSVDLYAAGRKVSGNAFCFRRNKSLHHGTLLIHADLSRLHGLLSPVYMPIETHAVVSRPATTANLTAVCPGISVGSVATGLAKAYLQRIGETETISPEDYDHPGMTELVERNRSWEWNFGRTPNFRLKVAGVTVEIRKGVIHSIEGDRPAGGTAPPSEAAAAQLNGVHFRKPELAKLLKKAPAGCEALLSGLHSIAV